MSMPPRDPPQRTFKDVLDQQSLRGLLIIGVGLVVVGVWSAATGFRHVSPFWVLGCAAVGGLVVASVLLNFVHPGLKDPRWSKTPTRRAARFAFSHIWWVFVVVMLVSGWIDSH